MTGSETGRPEMISDETPKKCQRCGLDENLCGCTTPGRKA
jgi:hypothetical protein